MKNIFKKILFLFVLVVTALVCLAFSASALAETGQCGENVYWDYNETTGELVISGSGDMYDHVHDGSPFYNSLIKSVVIKDGVTSIGEHIFWKCGYLENIIFSDSLKTIGEAAFSECTKIERIEIPDSVTSMGSSAFSDCENLKSVKLSNGMTVVNSATFYDCISLTEIDFPENLTTIGQQAFQGCDSFTEFRVPDGVEIVNGHVFCGCDNLEKVYIPSSVKAIYFGAFIYCKNLKEIEIDEGNENYCSDENGVVYSKDKTILKFYPTGKTNKEYVIPNGVKTIGGTAFCGVYSNTQNIWNGRYCNRSLQTVVIPRSVTEIKDCAFFYYTALKEIIFLGTEDEWNKISIGDLNFYKASPTFYYKNVVEQFPSGYNFDRDRYSFRNRDVSDVVSEEIYKDVFGDEKGELIYNKHERGKDSHGLCYGIAATTGSLLLDVPTVNSFIRYVGPCEYISDINRGTKCFELGTITAKNFIKYGYVTQFSTQAKLTYDCSAIYNAVEEYVYNDGAPVTLTLREFVYEFDNQKNKYVWNNPFAHTVLAVGLEGDNGIIVDDSNKETKQTIYFTRDANGNFTNEWTYSGYPETTNGTNIFDKSIGTARIIGYNTSVALPYLVLAGNAQLEGDPDWAYEDESHEVDLETKMLDKEYNLVSVNSDLYNIISDDNYLLELDNPAMGEISSDKNNSLYWIHNNSGITVSNFESDNNEVIVATNDIALEVVVCKDSTVKMKPNDETENLEAEIDVVFGKEYSIALDTTDVNGSDTDITITGTASGSEITATQTETGLLVTGISDGTVTLTKDDEVIATQEINDAVSDIEITYDKNGADEEVDVDYHSHSYTSSITTPSTHLTEGIETFTCSCGDSYTKPVARLEEHTYTSAITTPATHLTEGVETFSCSCGDSYTKPVAKLEEHKYVASNTVAPSCEKGGYTVYTCECGHSYNGDKTSATGHSYVEGVCSTCGESKVDNCSCNCHKSGFMGFIWKFINLFNKLFKMNKTCSCGVSHY